LATRLLQKLGAEVQVAANGIEVLAALRQSSFDAVLMDCQMPQMDGYEATRRIRDADAGVKNLHIPVIALTAHAQAADRTKCLEAGMNDYLTKPINPSHLKQALTKAVAPASKRAAASAHDAGLFDAQALLAKTDNDRGFAHELVNLFVRSARETLAQLTLAVQSGGDAETIRKLAHGIKGAAATSCATAVAACAANLERVAGGAQAMAALNSLDATFALTTAEWARLGWCTLEAADVPLRSSHIDGMVS
jgi:CheY-like chemotaxis protein